MIGPTGARILNHKGFQYRVDGYNSEKGCSYWRCYTKRVNKCKGRVILDGNTNQVTVTYLHDHPPLNES